MIGATDTYVPSAEEMRGQLRIFRDPMPCIEVHRGARYAGRLVSLARHAPIVFDEEDGSISLSCDEESAIQTLSRGRPPTLRRSMIDVLAVGCEVREGLGGPILVGHVMPHSGRDYDVHVVIGMAATFSLFPSEIDAVAAMLPEVLWRAGWLDGDVPDPLDARLGTLTKSLKSLVSAA